jgi:hypothetical protein
MSALMEEISVPMRSNAERTRIKRDLASRVITALCEADKEKLGATCALLDKFNKPMMDSVVLETLMMLPDGVLESLATLLENCK